VHESFAERPPPISDSKIGRAARRGQAGRAGLTRGRALPASDTVAPGAAVTAEPVGEAAAGEANDLGGDAAVAAARLADQLRLTRAEVADRQRVARHAGRHDFRTIGRSWGHVGSSSRPRMTRSFGESSRRSSRPPHSLSPRLARSKRLSSNWGPLPYRGKRDPWHLSTRPSVALDPPGGDGVDPGPARPLPRPHRPALTRRRGAALPLCLTPAALDAAQGLDQNHRTNDRAPDGSPASAPRVKPLYVSYPLGFAPDGR
jgi:hypothetical protein